MGNFCGSKELAYQTHQEPIFQNYTRKSTKISIFTQSYQDIQDYNDDNLLCTPFPNFCNNNGDSTQEEGRTTNRGSTKQLDDIDLKTSDDEYFNVKNYRTGTFKKPELRLSLKSSTFRPMQENKSPEKTERKIRLGYHQYLNSNKIQETEQSVAQNTIDMNDKYSSSSDSSSDENQLRQIDIRNPRRGSRNLPFQDSSNPQQYSKTTKFQHTPQIRFLELGVEGQNKSLNKTIYSPINQTVVNNNWNDDSSLNPVQTSGLLDEITPFQSFIKGSNLLQKKSEQKLNKNIKNKISLNNAPRMMMDSDEDDKQDEDQYNFEDNFKGQDTQLDLDMLKDMITPRFDLNTSQMQNVYQNNNSNLLENSVFSKISNDTSFDQIRIQNYKEFIKNYVIEDKAQFKDLLKNNISPLIKREIKQGDDHKIIFEGSFWVQMRANGSYVNRWCQLSNNNLLFYDDEYSSKSFQPPLNKILLSENVNIQKSKDFYAARDQDKFEFKLMIRQKNSSNTEFINQRLLKGMAQTKSDLSIGDVSAINLREQDRSQNNNNQTLSFFEENEIFSPTENIIHKQITFQSHNFNQSAKFILIIQLLLKIIKD
ncbi:UNKNOWN [Stylonychia lemnae]|uniref:PH domain-containing protein n=1 Tax=Stylonychia lemnae TaxID=5949 RepID=A0A078AIM4_STYLE|nr:UNKNOWN [Stylonychia lemnae]|eukprot:CDW80663.1 UNKNOWN [Stylonychia lemnae]